MISNKAQLFDLIDSLHVGLRNAAIIKDAVDDFFVSIEKDLTKTNQYTIWHDGNEWIVSINSKENSNCKTLQEWLQQQS